MLHQHLRLRKKTISVEMDMDVLIGTLTQPFEDVIDQGGDYRWLTSRDVDAVDDDIVGQYLVDAAEELVSVEVSNCRTVGIRTEKTVGIAPSGNLNEKVDRRGNGLCGNARTVATVCLENNGMPEEFMIAHCSFGRLCIL